MEQKRCQAVNRRNLREGKASAVLDKDIAARRAAEEKLRQLNATLEQRVAERAAELQGSETRFRTIFEHAPIGVALGDLDGRLSFVNPALHRMLGYEDGELIGKNFREFSFEKHIPAEESFLAEMAAGKRERYEIEKRYVRKDGRTVWANLSTAVLRDSGGKPALGLAMLQDITERKHAQQALELRSRQLAELATQVTMVEHRERRRLADRLHDHLQQLLVGARMEAHAVASVQLPREREALGHLTRTLTEAIDVARSISRDLAPPVAVHGHLPDAFRWLANEAGQRHRLEVHVRIRGPLAEVPEAESILLFTAARELLLNVVKHAGVQQAEVELARRADSVVLKVRDRGRGLDLNRLASQKQRGFGLFSIQERVDSLGGSFALESRPGCGVVVTVSAPIPAAARPPRREPRGRRKTGSTPGARNG